jgi:signal transduction histidine kinase
LQRWLDRRFPRESLDQSLLREATSDFVHEIKRPLANISMPVQLALMDVQQFVDKAISSDKFVQLLRKRLSYVLQESLEAGDMVEAIRALSSKKPSVFVSLDVREILDRVLEREQRRLSERDIKVVRDFKDIDPIMGNDRQLEIAFNNIVKNAIDALEPIEISRPRQVRAAVDATAESVVVDIEDSGPGITPNDISKLFDPWFSTKGSSGMGIGLFLTKEIFRGHSASIDVKSQLGEGSRFRVTFPISS